MGFGARVKAVGDLRRVLLREVWGLGFRGVGIWGNFWQRLQSGVWLGFFDWVSEWGRVGKRVGNCWGDGGVWALYIIKMKERGVGSREWRGEEEGFWGYGERIKESFGVGA